MTDFLRAIKWSNFTFAKFARQLFCFEELETPIYILRSTFVQEYFRMINGRKVDTIYP